MQPLYLQNRNSNSALELSIVLPCRNEAAALLKCIEQIKATMQTLTKNYEIIVSDSSKDDSPGIARQNGCVLISHGQIGYGVACNLGIQAAQGKYIILADADWTYDFSKIPEFMMLIESGCDLVIGNRLNLQMESKAMPWLHRHIGNPLLTFILKVLFNSKVSDSQCGMRGFSKDAYLRLNLKCDGMEFASEMIAAAECSKLKIGQVSMCYRRRIGESKLRPLPDGLRHLRFLVAFYLKNLFVLKVSPSWRLLRKL